jgi:hypothetical protein
MKDLGLLKYCLGIEVNQDLNNGLTSISQTKYINEVLEAYNMKDCNAASTPMIPNLKLRQSLNEENISHPYREAVGKLLYIAGNTRPDISFATSQVSQFLNNPSEEHWKAVQQIFRYLKGTMEYSINYQKQNALNLTAHCDSDWAGSHEGFKSISGTMILLNGSDNLEIKKTILCCKIHDGIR